MASSHFSFPRLAKYRTRHVKNEEPLSRGRGGGGVAGNFILAPLLLERLEKCHLAPSCEGKLFIKKIASFEL